MQKTNFHAQTIVRFYRGLVENKLDQVFISGMHSEWIKKNIELRHRPDRPDSNLVLYISDFHRLAYIIDLNISSKIDKVTTADKNAKLDMKTKYAHKLMYYFYKLVRTCAKDDSLRESLDMIAVAETRAGGLTVKGGGMSGILSKFVSVMKTAGMDIPDNAAQVMEDDANISDFFSDMLEKGNGNNLISTISETFKSVKDNKDPAELTSVMSSALSRHIGDSAGISKSKIEEISRGALGMVSKLTQKEESEESEESESEESDED